MTGKKKHSQKIKDACSELELALDQFKSVKASSNRADDGQRLEGMRSSLEQIKKQLDSLS